MGIDQRNKWRYISDNIILKEKGENIEKHLRLDQYR